ncbi:class I SAM-dependent methyltransferase [Actibacterium pelagium]|uniref:MFS transporter n=1 Tax=Actibacterium pelagium TaxID=2029103 RepID=A0A917EL12_9RHOB|nr:class I SAM-dependent methyltransferase [Actibacterium pelagium]GGE50129.1 MFS transporter [Actibacterium pelagium]
MKASRLTLAIEAGYDLPEDGRIAVIGARASDDLSALPKDRVQVIQGFKPDYDYWRGLGYDCVAEPDGTYAAAILFLPRSKAQAQEQIADLATRVEGPIWVDGQKTDGVDSLLKHCRQRADVDAPLAKAHGKLFAMRAEAKDFSDWQATATEIGTFTTLPGVFSADGVDRGSELLVEALPEMMKGRIADLGAGWGFLSFHALRKGGVTEVHLVEADHLALECARQNVHDARAQFHWADATSFNDGAPFDHVICNPPFHTGRAAEPELGQAFLKNAARILTPSGQLWVVANRQLPYEQTLAQLFRNVEEIGGDRGFKLLHATRPLAQGRRKR